MIMSEKIAYPLEGRARDSAVSVPPSYTSAATQAEVPDLSARLQNLSLKGSEREHLPSTDHLTAHLKLLESFYRLREDIGTREGLFGISSLPGHLSPEQQVRIVEKRWAVFVTRAVDRFERWYTTCAPSTSQGISTGPITLRELKAKDFSKVHQSTYTYAFNTDILPPLGEFRELPASKSRD